MGKVAVTYRIMPAGVDVNLLQVEDQIKDKIFDSYLAKLQEKPIAFGLKYLEVVLVMDDANNRSAEIETNFSTIQGVQSVEIIDVNLI